MPGSSLELPFLKLKHLTGHKTSGNPYYTGKLTVLNHSGVIVLIVLIVFQLSIFANK